MAGPRLGRAEIAAPREADIALPDDQRNIVPVPQRGADAHWISVIDDDDFANERIGGKPVQALEQDRPRLIADDDRRNPRSWA
mgnify:CR=1 FL=1